MTHIRPFAAMLALVGLSSVEAASFDCAKAATKVEQEHDQPVSPRSLVHHAVAVDPAFHHSPSPGSGLARAARRLLCS